MPEIKATITIGWTDDPYLLLANGKVMMPLSTIKQHCGPAAQEALDRWAAKLKESDEIARSRANAIPYGTPWPRR